MGWTDKLPGALGGSVDQKIQEHWPAVQQLFREKAGPALQGHLNDPEKVTSSSKIVYGLLPMPVRLFVKEDVFVKFCLEHKDKLLG